MSKPPLEAQRAEEPSLAAIDGLAGGGHMGALLREFDWSKTELGAVTEWPQSLRTAVSIMLDSAFGMVVAWGPEFIFLYNDRYRPVLGSTKHPGALGRAAKAIFPEVWHFIGPLFERTRHGEAVALDDVLIPLDRNGYLEDCYFTLSYSPIRDESGGVGGMLAVVAETTERVQGERRLATLRDLAALAEARGAEEACAQAERVLSNNPTDVPFALLYLLEPGGRKARLAGLIGLERTASAAPELISLDERDGWPLQACSASREPVVLTDLATRFGRLPGGAYDEPTHTALILPMLRAGHDQPHGFFIAGVSPRRELDDRYRTFFELGRDHIVAAIGNARAYEEERKRAEALAEIDREKTLFFSNVSHEFRTPLTLMLGPTEDALASAAQTLTGDGLMTVHRNGLRLLRLVNTLLDFSRIEAGRAQACFEPTDLAAVTSDLASAFRSAIERGGLRYEVDCPALSEPSYVDDEMWEKIVLNLISNAFKFTFDGTIRVSLREVGARVELAVEDSGIGIAETELPRVFERFHRIEGAQSRTHEGSGIGLALVHDLVKLHGGEIRVNSKLGRGTTFKVSIPKGAAHLPAERLGTADRLASTSAGTEAYVAEALRWLPDPAVEPSFGLPAPVLSLQERAESACILVADDNSDMRDYLSRLLGQRWTVRTASDGVNALAIAREQRPDLVLSDVMMPNLDGFGFLRALRADPDTANIPFIMLSARAGEESRIEGLEVGADDYLIKPFSARELMARVSTHLQLAASRRALELERANLVAANRTKDEFLAVLGHELRNPLAPIMTALHLMRLRGGDKAEKERAVIERQAHHLVRLVNDLLDVSRITRGKVELKKQRVEMAEIVARAIETASPLLEQRQHHLDIDVAAHGLLVDADPGRMAQVIANLLTNAAKYTETAGHISIAAKHSDGQVVIRVRDTGIGIQAEMLPQIFDMFVQERQALDRSQGGLGLGLTIVRSFVELHGGRVEAQSDGRNKGSEFIVRIPAGVAQPTLAPELVASAAAQPSARPNGRRILVVDDNEDAADILALSLELMGHTTRVAHDGPSALKLVDEFTPEVALLDIGLPVMDGYELARRFHERPDLAGVRIIAVTGYGQESDRRHSQKAGFHAHMVKPISSERLESLIKELMTQPLTA